MSWNAQINSDFWIDSYTAELDPIEKVLFVYLLTSPHGNISGIYQIPLRNIATDTGIEKEMVIKILARFQKDGKVLYKDGWVCLKNRIKFNKMDNTSIKKGVEKRIKNCPDFINEFLNLPITNDTLYTPCVFLDKDIDKDIEIDKDKDKNSITKTKLKKEKNPQIKVLIDYFFDKHLEKKGKKVAIDGGKDGKTIDELLKTFTCDEIKAKIDAFMVLEDKWMKENEVPFTIGIFKSQINKIGVVQAKDKPLKSFGGERYGKDY